MNIQQIWNQLAQIKLIIAKGDCGERKGSINCVVFDLFLMNQVFIY